MDAVSMSGGIDAWNGFVSRAEVDQGMYLIEGNEGSEEVISLAYGLEVGAYRFYRGLSEKSSDAESSGLFDTLAKAELQHRERLWEKYQAVVEKPMTRESFESGIVPETMEGGKTADQVLAQYPDWIHDTRESLQLAMSLETDALDLYLRMAGKSESDEAKAIFFELAEEEKTHLRRLGEFLRGKFPPA
jgi:rubrerythrin